MNSRVAATAYQDTLGDLVLGLLGGLVGASLAAWLMDRSLRGTDRLREGQE